MDDRIKVRLTSALICDIFEELLDKYNITIPDEDRTGADDEGRLYGLTYFNLETEVTEALRTLIEYVKKNPDMQCDYNDY